MDSKTPDVDSDATTASTATIAWRSRRTMTIAGVTAVVVLASAGLLVWLTAPPEPDDVVREFFSAIQQGDVDKALDLVAPADRPSGEKARFLTADAIGGGWRVTGVALKDDPLRSGTEVEVTFSLSNGTHTAGEFRLVDTDDGWLLDDPFVTYTPRPSPLWYIAVNDMTVPWETFDELALEQSYELFPGEYRLQRSTSEGVESAAKPVMLLPGNPARSFGPAATPEITVTPKALPPIQKIANAHVDECARRTTVTNTGCPFGIDPFDDRITLADGVILTGIANVRWKVLRYPTVELAVGRPLGSFGGHFAITASRQGLVELSGTRFDGGQQRTAFTTRCGIAGISLVAGLTADGTISVVPRRERYGDATSVTEPEPCYLVKA